MGFNLIPVRIVVRATGNGTKTRSHFESPADGRCTVGAELVSYPSPGGVGFEFIGRECALGKNNISLIEVDTDAIGGASAQFTCGAMTGHCTNRLCGGVVSNCTTLTTTFLLCRIHAVTPEFDTAIVYQSCYSGCGVRLAVRSMVFGLLHAVRGCETYHMFGDLEPVVCA